PPVVEQPKLPDPDIALEQEKLRLKKEKLKALEKEKLQEKQRLEKLQQEKLKQEKLALEKKRLQDKLDQEKKALEDKKKLAQDSKRKEALEAQQDIKKIEAMRNEQLKRMAGLAGGTGAPDSKGAALKSSGPSASYGGRIRAKIKPNIVFADEVVGNPLAEVEVRTAPEGTIISRRLIKSSGDKSWDDAVLRAIDKTEVLPRDVDGRVPSSLVISFRPKD
ncbi:MAG: cell envelope integrity protein TolA, partial [Pseudomonadota bacterium]